MATVFFVKIVALFHFAQNAQLFLVAMLDVKSNKKSYQRLCRSKKKRPFQKSNITEGDTASTNILAEKLEKSGDNSFNVHCGKLMSYVIIHFQMLVTFLQENLKLE